MKRKLYLFICHFIPRRLKHGAPMCCLRGKEVLLRIVSEDFHKQDRLILELPQWIDIDEVKQMLGVTLNEFIEKSSNISENLDTFAKRGLSSGKGLW